MLDKIVSQVWGAVLYGCRLARTWFVLVHHRVVFGLSSFIRARGIWRHCRPHCIIGTSFTSPLKLQNAS